MNIIIVKDFNSMQAITVGLARNNYFVNAESKTDDSYKDYWEIKYCEISEINKIPVNNGSDWDGDHIGSMEIHNKDKTKGIKNEILSEEKPLVENEKEVLDPNPAELIPRHSVPDIPNIGNKAPDSEPKIMEVRNDADDYIRD